MKVRTHRRAGFVGVDLPQSHSGMAQQGVHGGRRLGLHFTADIRLSCTRPWQSPYVPVKRYLYPAPWRTSLQSASVLITALIKISGNSRRGWTRSSSRTRPRATSARHRLAGRCSWNGQSRRPNSTRHVETPSAAVHLAKTWFSLINWQIVEADRRSESSCRRSVLGFVDETRPCRFPGQMENQRRTARPGGETGLGGRRGGAANECGARRQLPRVIVSGIIKFDANASDALSRREAAVETVDIKPEIRCCSQLTAEISLREGESQTSGIVSFRRVSTTTIPPSILSYPIK